MKAGGAAPRDVDERALMAGFDEIAGSAKGAFDRAFDAVVADFHTRVDRATNSFLDRAVASLLDHLEEKGEKKVWSYEPTGLRLLLRSAYTVFARKAQGVTDAAMSELYSEAFGLEEGAVRIETAPPPRVPAPVLLGQTIALDIKGNWWRNWWKRRRGYDAYAGDFLEMIRAEIDPVISGLKDSHVDSVRDEALATLERFFAEQRDILGQVAARAQDGETGEAGFSVSSAAEKRAAIDETLAALTEYAA